MKALLTLVIALASCGLSLAAEPAVKVWPETVFLGNPYSITVLNFRPVEPVHIDADVICSDGTKKSLELAMLGGPDKHGAAHVELPADGCAGAYSVTVTQGKFRH